MRNEQRQTPRKILKVKSVLVMDGAAPVQVRTSDIGANGISVTVPHPLHGGETGTVAFDLLVEGKLVPIQARAKVMYCIFSNGEFKVGFQFLNLDLGAMTQLARFLR
jgi:hypothetical protein